MMVEPLDFFFSPYPTAQQRRLQAALEDGLAHGSRIEPQDPLPDQVVALLFSSNTQMSLDQVAVYYTTDGSKPRGVRGVAQQGQALFAQLGEAVYDDTFGTTVQQWHAEIPGQPDGTVVQYRAEGWCNGLERSWYADSSDPVSVAPPDGRIFAYHVDRWVPPAWWDDAVVYQIFVDRFNAAHNEPPLRRHDEGKITDYYGGTLQGVLEKLDYMQNLGITCIWLSPVFESPVYHGYNPSDYYHVARRYGTNDTLRQLVQEAHRRGMRVMFDFVANHTSNEHPAFLGAREPGSDTASWYAFDDLSPHGYRSYALVRNMPELMTDNPSVQRYLFDAALHWLDFFGADGLRLDYVPGPSHAFWALFQQAIKERFPQALTLGEITAPLNEIAAYAGRMDAFMDFPLAKVLRQVFATRSMTLKELFEYLEARQAILPATMRRATLLDNHDMHRFLWLAGEDVRRLKLAAVCQLTLGGTPILYYGTEAGLSQYEDAHRENAHARAPMLWGEQQDRDLLEHFRRLIALRQRWPALRHGALTTVPFDVVGGLGADQVIAYMRHMPDEAALIVLNNTDHPVQVRISWVELARLQGQEVSTLLTLLPTYHPGTRERTDTFLEVELEGLGAGIVL